MNRYSQYRESGVYDGHGGNHRASFQPPARAGTFPAAAPQGGYSYSITGGGTGASQQQQHLHAPQRSSTFRPTSSIYSQGSPHYNDYNKYSDYNDRYSAAAPQQWNNSADISPPSSPEVQPRDGPLQQPSPDISPIDEEVNPFAMPHPTQSQGPAPGPQPQPSTRTNIPSMRRERRQNQDAAARTIRETKSRERMRQQIPPTDDDQAQQAHAAMLSRRGYQGGEVRWDPRTGELTSDSKGRPSQVKPKEYASGLGISGSVSPDPDTQHVESKKVPTSLGDRWRKMAKGAESRIKERVVSPTDPAAGAFTSNRPAWNGASGRSAIVEPVQDTRNVAPLRIPQKVNKPVPTTSPGGGLDTIMASPPVSPPANPSVRKVVPSSQINSPATAPTKTAYPSPPLSSEPHAAPSPTNPNQNHQIKRKPPPQSSHQPNASISSTYSQSDIYNFNNYSSSTPPRPPAHADGWTQPPSRFSVTTYDATPRDSSEGFDPMADPSAPPLPTSSPNPAAGSSVMDRSRPERLRHVDHSPGANSPIKISIGGGWQSGTGAAAAQAQSASPRESMRPESHFSGDTSSIYKVLPPAPPEQTAKDRVTQLNAQLSGLAQRRANIAKGIKQMTELMPMDNLMASAAVLHKRELEKRKVENLRLEMSEIQREEYELGLKLHRAYKRLDRDAEYEPTGLWVRRVTG